MSHRKRHQAAEHAYDPADPHGFHAEHGGHHGHVIVAWQTLLLVLLALLAFTVLTVFQAQAEKYAAHHWGWTFPGWVNVVLAMTIACIKGALVVLFFMQLKYDKGINAILFLFTLFAVWLFLMFTTLDLTNRHRIIPWRGGEITHGGTGVGVRRDGASNKTLMTVPKAEYIAEHGEAAYEEHLHESHPAHGEGHSTAEASRSREGLTPGLFATGPWAELEDEHAGDGHEGEQTGGH